MSYRKASKRLFQSTCTYDFDYLHQDVTSRILKQTHPQKKSSISLFGFIFLVLVIFSMLSVPLPGLYS